MAKSAKAQSIHRSINTPTDPRIIGLTEEQLRMYNEECLNLMSPTGEIVGAFCEEDDKTIYNKAVIHDQAAEVRAVLYFLRMFFAQEGEVTLSEQAQCGLQVILEAVTDKLNFEKHCAC